MLLMVMCVFVCAMVARFNIADEPKIYYLIHIEREFVVRACVMAISWELVFLCAAVSEELQL